MFLSRQICWILERIAMFSRIYMEIERVALIDGNISLQSDCALYSALPNNHLQQCESIWSQNGHQASKLAGHVSPQTVWCVNRAHSPVVVLTPLSQRVGPCRLAGKPRLAPPTTLDPSSANRAVRYCVRVVPDLP